MTGEPEGGSESAFRARAGALTLLYLSSPMERSVLLALLAEAATGVEVLEDLEPPIPNDPRDIARIFNDPYLIEPADPDLGPGDPIGPDTLLQPTPAGREVPFVGEVLQHWLDLCPAGPVELGPDAGPALSALLGGWSAAVIHALAERPLTAAEATEAVATLADEIVELRIEEMERVGLLEAFIDDADEERFEATEWLRMAIAPLAASARLELRFPPGDTAPIAARDVEAAFLLTLPLLELPAELSGTCTLAVDLDEDVSPSPAGVTARVEEGRVVSCETGLDESADARGAASAGDWLDTVIESDAKLVRSAGDQRLPSTLLDALHETLFGVAVS